MKLSVVVPSYRRPQDLKRCLAALARQERLADEVLIVHRIDDIDTAAVVAQTSLRGLRGVIVDRPGLVAAMDAGATAGEGEVIAFTDDDAAPRIDWLRRIEACLQANERIAGIGGRDWCWYDSQLITEGHHPRVGRVQWFGRLTSGHHVGDGDPQNVHVLKGCNMAFRTDVLIDIGFDHRLRGQGAQAHNELSLCLEARRRGWTLRYDPSVAVDHYPAPRHDSDQRHRPAFEAVEDSAHNETLALLEHMSRGRRLAFGIWSSVIGTRPSPGLLQAVRRRLHGDRRAIAHFRAVMRGRRAGWATYRAYRQRRPALDGVVVVIHSRSGLDRAQQLFGSTRIVFGGRSLNGLLRTTLLVARPDTRTVYLIDLGISTAFAAVVGRALGRRVIVDTGDLGYELARSVGRRGRLGIALVWLGERTALALAQHVVVRGTAHISHLGGKSATVIRDLPPTGARPVDGAAVRRELDLEDRFVVGLVGSLNYAPRLAIGYGWDLIEALALCESSVVGLIVGDGAGRPVLEARARELGISDRVRFVGRLESRWTIAAIGAMDMAISTQTNDGVGAVRTTGKLPLYLACGCPVIASHVGEAASLLGPLGWTLNYAGIVDPSYPARLAEAITRWSQDPGRQAEREATAVRLGAQEFDAVIAREQVIATLR